MADQRVVVLDPCCGTGAYLVEVLKKINRTLNEEQSLGQGANEIPVITCDRLAITLRGHIHQQSARTDSVA